MSRDTSDDVMEEILSSSYRRHVTGWGGTLRDRGIELEKTSTLSASMIQSRINT